MNNLFQINPENLNNFLTNYNYVEYAPAKIITKINTKPKSKPKSKSKSKSKPKSKPNANPIKSDTNHFKINLQTNENNFVWEFGKSKIKIDLIKKYLKYNLNVFENINKLFINFADAYSKKSIKEIIEENLNIDKKLYKNSHGIICLISNKFYIGLTQNNNLVGIYNLIDVGYTEFYNINLDENILKIYNISNLNKQNYGNENIFNILKILKLNELENIFDSKSNSYGNLNLTNIINDNLSEIISELFLNNNFFNSNDKYSFYIKITDNNSTSFLIDKINMQMYYFSTVEIYKSSGSKFYLFHYVIAINPDYKISNLLDYLTNSTNLDKSNNLNKLNKLNNLNNLENSAELNNSTNLDKLNNLTNSNNLDKSNELDKEVRLIIEDIIDNILRTI